MRTWILPLALLNLAACRGEKDKGEAPPPSTPVAERPCEGVSDGPREGMPSRAAGLCMDPRSDVRRYGVGAPSSLSSVCVELFNGECELYRTYGLEGVKTLRYVAEDGAATSVNVVVSSFRRSSGAFGFFTQRVLGGDLPSQATVVPLVATGRAVSGLGMTVLWRGKQVVETTYVNEVETPKEIEERSPLVLHPLTREISRMLVGPTEPERAVRFLEMEELDTLGVFVVTDGLLGAIGTGPGSIGYFSKSKYPHRILIADHRDPEGSRDLLRLLRQTNASKKLEGRDVIRLRHTREGAPPETWYIRRQDEVLLGVGPLSDDGEPSLSTPKEREIFDKQWEDFAVSRLTQISNRELKFK
jgi:hypothetical protein